MKVYLAGPMSGVPNFNFPAFHEAARALRIQGHEVFNPAENDIKKAGRDISIGNVTGNPNLVPEFSRRDALGDDLAWICREAEAIALLPGWERSTGATAERAVSIALGLEIMYL